MSQPDSRLPTGKQLEELLDLKLGYGVEDLIAQTLLSPLQEFLTRPGKQIRGQMVELGFCLAAEGAWKSPAAEDQRKIAGASSMLEAIHAGSLVVDDIQDGSQLRRGEPAFHLRYGVPQAINAGNWLYFWPLERIREWQLEPARELKLYQICVDALLRAHFGQAIDVGVRIDSLPQSRIAPACLASLELKTGALTALGITVGAILGNASEERYQILKDFGLRFGVALQMFDDLGNLRAKPDDPKRYEDLRLGRPSWVWATVAERCTEKEFHQFSEATHHLPDDKPLLSWLANHNFFSCAQREAKTQLEGALQKLDQMLTSAGQFGEGVERLRTLAERLSNSYG